MKWINWTLAILFFSLIVYACMPKPKVMTPTDFVNIVLQAIYKNDSVAYMDRAPNLNKYKEALKLARLPDSKRNKELDAIGKTEFMENERLLAMRDFHIIQEKMSLYKLQQLVFDSVDFYNYFSTQRPYIHMSANAYFNMDTATYVFTVTDAKLLKDGWNLGRLDIVRKDSGAVFIKEKEELYKNLDFKKFDDSIKELNRLDPKRVNW